MTDGKPKRARRAAEQMLVELKQRLREISDLNAAGSVLNWDQATYMPQAGAAARGRQLAMLGSLAHERAVAPALGRLLDSLVGYGASLPYDSDDSSLIRVAHREYQKKIKVPPDHIARAIAQGSASYDAWTRARPANDFATMVPYLERTLDLSREYSSYFAPYKHVADPHIDDADEGMTTASTHKLFEELKTHLVPIVRAICEQPAADDSSLRQTFAKAAQLDFARHVAERLGYDLRRGRLDLTLHPFSTRFSADDVRITTRVSENDFGDALFSTLHEAGHAMYEQGISAALDGTPLGRGASAGVHESQSRLWENVVGRSRGFWEHFYPSLQRIFAEQLSCVPLAAFHHAINRVARSLIRTDADEVTYNLHIMLRFNLELRLLEGARLRACKTCRRLGVRQCKPTLASRHPTIATAVCRTYIIGIPAPSARAISELRYRQHILSGVQSLCAAALKGHPDIPTSRRKSLAVNSAPCIPGCITIFTGTAASS